MMSKSDKHSYPILSQYILYLLKSMFDYIVKINVTRCRLALNMPATVESHHDVASDGIFFFYKPRLPVIDRYPDNITIDPDEDVCHSGERIQFTHIADQFAGDQLIINIIHFYPSLKYKYKY